MVLSHRIVAQTTELRVAVSGFSGIQREAFLTLAQDFHTLHPQIKVSFVLTEDSIFKNRLHDWLAQHNEFDLVVWHAGERLKTIAKAGYVHPIKDVWEQGQYNNYFSSAMLQACSYNDVPYGIPISTYQWGFYYNKSLFEQHKLKEPNTWDEFMSLIHTLKTLDIVPITLASGSGWPIAGWYEYLNLRVNGLGAQHRLNDMLIPINEKEVIKVLEHLKALISAGAFAEHHKLITWKSSLPAIFRGQAAMALYGNFLESALPKSVANNIGYFPFPQLGALEGNYEIAPTDILLIGQNSGNKLQSEAFLRYVAQPQVQEKLNLKLNQISPNSLSQVSETSPLAKEGIEVLKAADGLSQYFDREVNKELSDAYIKIWIDFINNPDIPTTIEKMQQVKTKQL